MAEEHKIKLIAEITPQVNKSETKKAVNEMQYELQEETNKNPVEVVPTIDDTAIKKSAEDIVTSVKSTFESTPIDLTPEIQSEDVITTSRILRDSIEQIKQSTEGVELDSKFLSLQNRMDGVVRKSIEVEAELEKLKKEYSGIGVPTAEYAEWEKQIEIVDKKTRDLQARMERFIATGGSKRSTAYQRMEYDLGLLQDKHEQYAIELDKLVDEGKDMIPVEASKEYQKLIAQQEELNNKMRMYGAQWNDAVASMNQAGANSTLDTTKKDISSANKALFGLSGSLRGITRMIPGISSRAVMSVSIIARSVMRLSTLTKKDLVSAINVVGKAFEKLLTAIVTNPILAVITGIVAGVIALTKAIKDTKKEVDEVFKFVKKIASTLSGLFKRIAVSGIKQISGLIGNIVKTVINSVKTIINKIKSLKSVVEENLKLMAKWKDGNNAVNKALSNLTSSLAYLKGSLAAAFAPILTYVEPVLTRLMDQLADVTNMIGMFVAKLTGATSYQKAVKTQKDYAKSLSDVSKAAKEATKSLASYDKLQVISKQNTEDSTEANNDSIDWEEISLSDFKLPDWLSKLSELGEKAGTKIRDMLSSIPWDSVKAGATKAAKGVTDFINGFASVEGLGASVGHTLAELGNTAIDVWNTIINETDWGNLGTQLGQMISTALKDFNFNELGNAFSGFVNSLALLLYNALLELDGKDIGKAITDLLASGLNIDWPTIKKAVEEAATKLADTINSVFTATNLKKVADAGANFLNTIFAGVQKFADTANFSEIGQSIATAFNDLIDKIDFTKAGKAVNSIATGILRLFSVAIGNINWEELIDEIVNFLDQIDWESIGDSIVKMSKTLRKAFDKLWKELEKEGVADEIIDLIVDVLNEKKNWEKAFKKFKGKIVAEVIKERIMDTLQGEGSNPFSYFFKELWRSVDFFRIAGEQFAEWDIVGGLVSIIKGVVGLATFSMTAGLGWLWDTVFAGMLGFDTAEEGLEKFWDGITDTCKECWETFRDFLIEIKDWLVVLWEDVKIDFSEGWSKFTEGLSKVKDSLVETWEDIKTGVKKPLNGLLSTLESFINYIVNGLNTLTDYLNNLSVNPPDWFSKFTGVGTIGFNLQRMSNVTLPRLAQGAVIPPNKEFAAILGDQKSGTNIETPVETMIDAFKQAMTETGGGNHEPIILQLSGKTVAQVVWDEQQKRYKQTGKYQFT